MRGAPRALLFDVFGTVVDWRSSVARELAAYFNPQGILRDWDSLDINVLGGAAIDIHS